MKIISVIVLCIAMFAATAQQKAIFVLPPASPEATVTQQMADGKITVAYSRPFARGRVIFGGLVPFDSLWRTGAGDATSIQLTNDCIVSGRLIAKGKYSLFSIPAQKEWTIILNADTALHGTDEYDSNKDIYRFKVPSSNSVSFTEAFTISINEIDNKGGGYLTLAWENTMVKILLESPQDKKMIDAINTRLLQNNEQQPELLYQAANYYYTTGRDLKLAAAWAAKAADADKEKFNYPNLLQKILADQQDYKAAIAAAERALALAEKNKMTTIATNLKKRIAAWTTKL
jgi:tetratricopeptide (TPR) repeat protein